ncbi:hypothetical protein CEXT_548871 [Caerostris extrusa]|uniref:Uncharacterized protein n=1 Tax=Caerostris extrusa TaxID=172846 RepID=A0AAV4SNH6_CAEEX|nr:hypothetical protein CEXT_548871 [Caerostris extrusa]
MNRSELTSETLTGPLLCSLDIPGNRCPPRLANPAFPFPNPNPHTPSPESSSIPIKSIPHHLTRTHRFPASSLTTQAQPPKLHLFPTPSKFMNMITEYTKQRPSLDGNSDYAGVLERSGRSTPSERK